MPHEPYSYVPLSLPMTTLSVADDIAIVRIPADATIVGLSGSIRTFVSGTESITLKNNTGTTLGTVTWVGAGNTSGTISVAAISSGDSIHFNVTSAGVSVVDCAITVWLRIGSLA